MYKTADSMTQHTVSQQIFFKDFIYLFLERREGKEKEKERNIHV